MKNIKSDNDLQEMLTQAIKEMEQDAGHKIGPDKINFVKAKIKLQEKWKIKM